MAAQNGKDLLIKLDMNGAGQFETIAGLRATRISLQPGFKLSQCTQSQLHKVTFPIQPDRHLALPRVRHLKAP